MFNLSKLSDEQLILKYKSGNDDALDILFGRKKALVLSIARMYFLSGGNNEDLIQEGMIGLHKAIVTFDDSKNVKFNQFAKTCIRTSILDALKIANRDKHKALNDSLSLTDAEINFDVVISPEDALIDEEKKRALKDRIYSFLTQPQQKLLTYFLEGYSYTEIASLMNKDIKYVDNTLQIIKRKIRRNLNIDN